MERWENWVKIKNPKHQSSLIIEAIIARDRCGWLLCYPSLTVHSHALLPVSLFSRRLRPLVTLVYPLYASVRAIETASPVDDQQWLTYWVLYSLITLFELTFAKLIEWYASVRAIETASPVDDQQWLTYWVLYSLITLFELTFAKLIEWLPFWPYAKLIFNCWLVLPYFSGAAYVYQHYVRPLFVNPQTVNIWYVPRKKDIFSRPDDVLLAAEKFIEENGLGAFEKLLKKAEKVAKPIEKVPKPTEKAPKPAEKAPRPRKTNHRVTFEDVEIDKTSKSQNSNNQAIFDNRSSHSILDYTNSHPIYDEVEPERGSQTWPDSSFMIFGDDYRY